MRSLIDIVEHAQDHGGVPYQGVLFHGTTNTFDKFDLDKLNATGAFGRGIYLSNDLTLARQYSKGSKPLKVKVQLKSAYVVDYDALDYSELLVRKRVFKPSNTARERLMSAGYDGVLIKQEGYVEVVVFDPKDVTIL